MRGSWMAGLGAIVVIGCVSMPNAEAFESAPPIEVAEWVTGEPIDFSQKGRTYVVELWATWCGPCRESLPHLAELQREKGDALAVLALSDERSGKVRSFVRRNNHMANLATGVDAEGGATTRAFSKQFGVRGIPHAFILDDRQQVLWHGHPGSMRSILSQVEAGTWTAESAGQLAVAEDRATEYLLGLQSEAPNARLDAIGREALDKGRHASDLMNELAWNLLTEVPEAHRPAAFALEVAEAAVAASQGKDHAVLDTHALALWTVGRKDEARTQQQRALDLCRAVEAQACDHYEQVLARYAE